MLAAVTRISNLSSVRRISGARILVIHPQKKLPRPSAPPGYRSSSLTASAVTGVDVGRKVVAERLSYIDGAVRAHEQAHLAALGPYARSGADYSYMIGPDGRRYAVGGSVDVSLQPVPGDPEATIRKAKALIRGAYAPTSPSGPDMRVAAEAYRMEMEAKRELERKESLRGKQNGGFSLYA
jgi:hypothetical protein